jgi:Icc-related predicted phosphoesterase
MKICFVSDTHCQYPNLPPADLLVHAGDLTGSGSLSAFGREIDWLSSLRPQYPLGIIFVPGNHDRGLDEKQVLKSYTQMLENNFTIPKNGLKDSAKIRKLMNEAGITVLIDESTVIEGIHFYGSPMTRTFYDWAFMAPERSLKRYWAKIPEETQILITHGPPKFILDAVGAEHLGSPSLSERVKALKNLKVHAFGHIHEGAGTIKVWDKHFINAAALDGRYRGFNRVFVLDSNTWEIESFPA